MTKEVARRRTTRIRRAIAADARALTRIAHAAKRHWGYPEKQIRSWRGDLTATSTTIAADPTYCALRGERIAGWYAISGDGDERELEHMWVEPRHIGTGLGRLLFRHLVRRLRAMEVRRLKIASDPNAEGFYQAMGARRIGSVPSTPRGRRLPLLRLDVPPAAARRGS